MRRGPSKVLLRPPGDRRSIHSESPSRWKGRLEHRLIRSLRFGCAQFPLEANCISGTNPKNNSLMYLSKAGARSLCPTPDKSTHHRLTPPRVKEVSRVSFPLLGVSEALGRISPSTAKKVLMKKYGRCSFAPFLPEFKDQTTPPKGSFPPPQPSVLLPMLRPISKRALRPKRALINKGLFSTHLSVRTGCTSCT